MMEILVKVTYDSLNPLLSYSEDDSEASLNAKYPTGSLHFQSIEWLFLSQSCDSRSEMIKINGNAAARKLEATV